MKIILLTILLMVSSTTAMAQDRFENCVSNKSAPPAGSFYWPPDTAVRVFFMKGMFTPAQTESLLMAMKTWSVLSAQVGAGVSFIFSGEVEELMSCFGCLTVTRREVFKTDRKHYAFFNPLKQRSDGLLISAWIDLDFATTRPEALQGYMTHELGHGMGLSDCTTCEKRLTVMNGFSSINSHNGLLEPSSCDFEVVRRVYQLQRRVSSNRTTRD